ncbi:MAG: hypothetical protein A3I61_05545 [Acidobacteria bacterium RIFCSPLOWO2_02_FULL_68_18]|nr:MAG: hypothetical protein A3I61_05545 [Acidobacteria bacterium RIFCSPLOWO2_02_FULL_68_18]OFW48545.1 MAG: hypothetical protein A3G77_13800 [Acidobacteria bacterium RIFCSPLOWO2_12_FULL_68_19]
MALPVWVVDTSALIEIKSFVPRLRRAHVFTAFTAMVAAGRLRFPVQVVHELKRDVEGHPPDQACTWALSVETAACNVAASYEEVKAVLAVVPDVLDSMKESGVDEADPYVLALAVRLHAEGHDARVVVQETKDTPKKLSLNTACGMLGIPSVPLLGLLRAEGISTEA